MIEAYYQESVSVIGYFVITGKVKTGRLQCRRLFQKGTLSHGYYKRYKAIPTLKTNGCRASGIKDSILPCQSCFFRL